MTAPSESSPPPPLHSPHIPSASPPPPSPLQAAKADALLERAEVLRAELGAAVDSSWANFEGCVAVLRDAGAFQLGGPLEGGAAPGAGGPGGGRGRGAVAGRMQYNPLGEVAREVSGSNELWLAVVMTHPAVSALPPQQLAAALSAVVAPEAVSRPNVWTAYPASEAVSAAGVCGCAPMHGCTCSGGGIQGLGYDCSPGMLHLAGSGEQRDGGGSAGTAVLTGHVIADKPPPQTHPPHLPPLTEEPCALQLRRWSPPARVLRCCRFVRVWRCPRLLTCGWRGWWRPGRRGQTGVRGGEGRGGCWGASLFCSRELYACGRVHVRTAQYVCAVKLTLNTLRPPPIPSPFACS